MRFIRQGLAAGRSDTGFVSDILMASWQFHYLNKCDSAIALAKEALRMSRVLHHLSGEANALRAIGVNHRFEDHYDSALVYLQASGAIFDQLQDNNMILATLIIEANTYVSMAQYSKAVDYTFQAIALSDSLIRQKKLPENIDLIYNFYENLGIVFTQLGMYDLALEHFATSINHAKRLGQENKGTLYFIGNLYSEMHEYAKAREYYERVTATPNFATSQSHVYTLCVRDLGKTLLAEGEQHRADSLLRFALEKLRTFQDKRGIARTLVILSALHFRQGKTRVALREAEEAIRLAAGIHALREQRDAYKAAAAAWARLGNTSEGFEMQKRYIALNDSIFSAQTTQRIAALNRNREFKRSEQQLLLVREQQEVEQLKARNTQIILLGTSIFFALIVVVVVVQYRTKRRSESALRRTNTEILAQQQRLENQNEELVRLNEEKNEFLNITSHDLRAPLANIVGLASMLEEDALAPSQRRTLSTIRSTAGRMTSLVEHLLEAGVIERGEITPRLRHCNLATVLTQVIEQYSSDIQAKSLTLHQSVNTEIFVLADVNFLEQVISNLISNAVKYSRAEGGIWITTDTDLLHKTASLTIRNEGMGLTERDMKRVFQKFARLSAQPTRGESSTGLGLYITKKLVDAMHGKVWCTSVEGQEATFVVELPMAQ